MKIEKKAVEECGFTLTKHETLHLSQWMQKHLEQSNNIKGCGLLPTMGIIEEANPHGV
jgi:hypothetical protein